MAHRYELTLVRSGPLAAGNADGIWFTFAFGARPTGARAPLHLELHAGVSGTALSCKPWSMFSGNPEGARKQSYAHLRACLASGDLTEADLNGSPPRRFMITSEHAVYDTSDLDSVFSVEVQPPVPGR